MQRKSASYWAYQILYVGFIVAPILAGVDKFTNLLTNWDMYLAPAVTNIIPLSAGFLMRIVGVVEIAAGVLVAVKPRIGGMIVSGWLAAIIVNLLLTKGFYDIALRDFGLALGAFALSLLSRECICKPQTTAL